ncbi:hypothetical protein ABH944_002068 [Caballeronia udeis]|jgi:hypothetical protein|uniref:Uncharacterized protein n=1 Tax=Caballeronia udeis TaxID=1232866 RepID=A0ABW8MFG5_9BURK
MGKDLFRTEPLMLGYVVTGSPFSLVATLRKL